MVARTPFPVALSTQGHVPVNLIKRRMPILRHIYVLLRTSYLRKLIFFALTLALALSAQSYSATDLLIYQVESRYNSARTLSVDFTENYAILGHRRPSESGTLILRKLGKMRWDYRQPQGKLFVSDGKTVYLFTARDNRVEKVALKTTDDMRAPLAFLLGKLDMKKEFHDFSTRPAGDGTWLVAQSRNSRLPYQSIEMLITGAGHIEQLLVSGRDQSITTYRFENEKLNPPVNDAIFHFQIPPGAQVVDALDFRSEEVR